MAQATPLYVVKALADVRENGSVNMMNRAGVTALVGDSRAIEWLDSSSDTQYLEALKDMGAYVSGEFVETESTADDDNDTPGYSW